MSTELQIDQMTLEERLRAMEELWMTSVSAWATYQSRNGRKIFWTSANV
ncbi:MAG TPA: hypothetical protein VN687_02995 [Blastocatellia bacterium]|nr:hypothetical protein [Blastocatellia bacterium]